MIVLTDFPQGSPEWFAARAGVLTASVLDRVVTSAGEPSKQARNLMLQLAGESILGTKPETYQSAAMARGIEMEDEARAAYEMITDQEVQTVGLVYRDEDRTVACSPDGMLPGGGLEIKCPLLHTAVDYLLRGGLPTDYVQQVQGSMWITGAEWWDFMSYYPGLPPHIVRVERDEGFIAKLSKQVDGVFLPSLGDTKALLRAKVGA